MLKTGSLRALYPNCPTKSGVARTRSRILAPARDFTAGTYVHLGDHDLLDGAVVGDSPRAARRTTRISAHRRLGGSDAIIFRDDHATVGHRPRRDS